MFSLITVAISSLLMAYALLLCRRTIAAMEKVANYKACRILFFLVLFFLIGYLVYFGLLILAIDGNSIHNVLISLIFLFGALFVIIIFKINLRLISILKEQRDKQLNLMDDIQAQNRELEDTKRELKKKNQQLEETMEDFYTMRTTISKQMRAGEFEDENQKIRDTIDELKHK